MAASPVIDACLGDGARDEDYSGRLLAEESMLNIGRYHGRHSRGRCVGLVRRRSITYLAYKLGIRRGTYT